MILIDSREGSVEMSHLIADSIIVTLEFGDASFMGTGPDGDVSIGIERKKISDLMNSIATGRLSGHQLPGLLTEYDKVYIIVEGVWRGNPATDIVESNRGRNWVDITHGRKFRASDIWSFLTTLENTGVIVRTTRNMTETCAMISNLERWWTKEWGRHRSHLALHKGTPTALLATSPPSLIRRIAAELPHIGFDRGRLVEQHFGSVAEMVNASMEEWEKIRGIGRLTAREVFEAINRKGG